MSEKPKNMSADEIRDVINALVNHKTTRQLRRAEAIWVLHYASIDNDMGLIANVIITLDSQTPHRADEDVRRMDNYLATSIETERDALSDE